MQKLNEGKLLEIVPIINKVPLGITLLDREMRVLLVNKSVEKSFGFKFEDVRGKFCYDVAGDGKVCEGCGAVKALKDGKVHFHERRVGPNLFTRNIAVPIKKNGEIVAVLEIGLDVTDAVSIQEELHEKEKEYQELFENSLDAIVVTDLKGRILRVNKGFERLTGYSRDEVTGKSYAELLPEPMARLVWEKYNEAFKENKNVYGIEFEYFRKDGERRVIEGNVTLIKKKGRVIGFLGNFRDITEKKRYEKTINDMNNTLRLINKIMRHDLLNDLTVINSALELFEEKRDEEILETSKKAVKRAMETIKRMREFEESTRVGKLKIVRVRDVVEKVASNYPLEISIVGDSEAIADEALATIFDNLIRNAINHGKTDKVDIKISRNDFCEIKVADYGKGIPDEIKGRIFDEGFSTDGTGLGLYIVKRIVERYGGSIGVEDNKPNGTVFTIKLRYPGSKTLETSLIDLDLISEPKLKEISRSFYRIFKILNSIREHIVYHGEDLRIKWVNNAAAESVDARPEELIGKFCYEVWHGRKTPCKNCPVYRAWENGKYEEGFIHSPDGRVWYTRANPVFEDGKLKGIVEVASEITEKVKLEEKLKESEQHYRMLVESSIDAIITVNSNAEIVSWNRSAEKIFGYKAGEVIGKPLTILIPEEFRKRFERGFNHFKLTLDSEELPGGRFETVGMRKDGEVFPIEITYYAWKSDDEIFFTSVIHDISEKKRLEEKLREREEMFRTFSEKSLVGIYLIQDGVFKYVNPKLAEDFGYRVEEIIGKRVLDFIYPPDRETVAENIRKRISGEIQSIRYRPRVKRKDGAVRTFEVFGTRTTIAGKPAILGTAIDITEEEDRRKRLEAYERFFMRAQDLFFVLDSKGRFVDVNPRYAEMLGYKREELIGHTARRFFASSEIDMAREMFQRVMKGESVRYEAKAIPKDGKSVFMVEINLWPVFDNGKIVGAEGIVRDVTERKKMEQKLKESEEMFRTLAEKSLVGIYLIQDGVFKYVNPKMAELWGYSVEELIGRSPLEFIYPADRETVRINIEKRIRGETESVNYKLRVVRKDGEVRHNEVFGSRIIYKGKPAVIGTLIDITERLELERAKHKAFEQIEKNIENYAILVDQIRNPLAVIQGLCEVVLDGKEELKELKQVINESVKRIEEVVERLDRGWLESEAIRKFLKGELRKSEF